jgi:hypothetical protein
VAERAWIAAVIAAFVLALAAATATAEGATVPFQRGVTVVEWGPTAYAPGPTRKLLSRLRRYGVDSVTIPVVWNQADARSNVVRRGGQTAPTRSLKAAIRAARARGMRVVLRPYVDLEDGDWRGFIEPRSLGRWFKSYRRFILRYARLAQRERATIFVIGSEMKSLSDETARWTNLVADVRDRYRGLVTYQANWDEFRSVEFWGSLDLISISAYFSLTRDGSYGVGDLVDGWRSPLFGPQSPFDQIEEVSREHGRDVIFGEIGYVPDARTAAVPWETMVVDPEPRFQRVAYEAAFRVWWAVPWFKGFHWWYVNPTPSLLRGTNSSNHQPRGGARCALRRWYRRDR